MKQYIAIIFDTNWNKKIEQIRQKYLHYANMINPHISLIYTFEIQDKYLIRKHISKVVSDFDSFELRLDKFGKSEKDLYLYLLANKGEDKLYELHQIV